MPKIEFDGQGVPIPTIALPPFGSDSDLPPTTLTFADNADFSVADYMAIGFTHYEVWCVGAAGGRGGDATSQYFFIWVDTWRPVPQDVWNLRLEQLRIYDYQVSGVWDLKRGYGIPGPRGDGFMTVVEAEEYQNPTHMLQFEINMSPVLWPTNEGMGGAGGGGGFQKVAGALADLPGLIPIVVGKAGNDSPYGQTTYNGVVTGAPSAPVLLDTSLPYPIGRQNEIQNFLTSYQYSYPPPYGSYPPPQPGGDGGASSFADAICQASGGQGGTPGKIWDGTKFIVNGSGGDGGIGGRLIPGGGGAGSTAEGINGADGIWHPETGIGAGGGGGKGGRSSTTTGLPPIGGGSFDPPVVTTHFATAGGQGSYSFGDTSVYGQRQFRQSWTYLRPVRGYSMILQPGNPPGLGNWANGTITYIPVTQSDALVIPGGGGGARPLGNLKVGSKAVGYSPNGIVVLRLTKITT